MDDFDDSTETPSLEAASPLDLGYREPGIVLTAMPRIYSLPVAEEPTMTRTMPQEHAARCRELADIHVDDSNLAISPNPQPDPRFASLRGEHEWRDDEGETRRAQDCGLCGALSDEGVASGIKVDAWLRTNPKHNPGYATHDDCVTDYESRRAGPYCLRTDGDALDEAIAACGWHVTIGHSHDGWEAVLVNRWGGEDVEVDYYGTPSEAKSAALWVAVLGG